MVLVGLLLFTHGELKNLRFAVVGDHVLAGDLGDSCVLGDDSDDWDSDRAASFCFNFKVVGGITENVAYIMQGTEDESCHGCDL